MANGMELDASSRDDKVDFVTGHDGSSACDVVATLLSTVVASVSVKKMMKSTVEQPTVYFGETTDRTAAVACSECTS